MEPGNDECGDWWDSRQLFGRVTSFSYQSSMSAGAGTPRYENWVHWLIDSGVVCAPAPHLAKPQPYISPSPSAVVVRAAVVGIAARCRDSFIFDQSLMTRLKIGTAHTPLDSGAVSGFGVCFRRKEGVSPRIGGIAVDVSARRRERSEPRRDAANVV